MGFFCTAVGSAIESYKIAPGMALWPMGKAGDGWLSLSTELDAVMDPDVWPDVCPLAGALLVVAPLMGELLAAVALAVALMAMGA